MWHDHTHKETRQQKEVGLRKGRLKKIEKGSGNIRVFINWGWEPLTTMNAHVSSLKRFSKIFYLFISIYKQQNLLQNLPEI